MDNTANGGLAASAATYLRQSGFTDVRSDCDSQEINRQSKSLVKWAADACAMLDIQCCQGLRKLECTTAEHEVYYRRSDNRALKITYAGCFGLAPDSSGDKRPATPLFYLNRIELMNDYFCSDIKLEGLIMRQSLLLDADGQQPSLVVSQPWHDAADERHLYPSEAEIADFMTKVGYRKKEDSYFGWETDETIVIDARSENFIKTAEGLVPIDLVICENQS